MKGIKWAIVLMAVALLLVGCGSGTGSGELEGTEWTLVTLSGKAPLPGRPPSVEFAAQEISGSAGCNTYFGTYDVKGNELTISDLANTEMWCADPEGLMDQETAFLAALRSVASYRLAGEQLELLDAAGHVSLAFEPRPGTP